MYADDGTTFQVSDLEIEWKARIDEEELEADIEELDRSTRNYYFAECNRRDIPRISYEGRDLLDEIIRNKSDKESR